VVYLVVGLQYLFAADVYWISVTQWVVPDKHPVMETVVDLAVPIGGVSVTILSSLLTVAYLMCSRSSARVRGSVTVLLMNFCLALWLLMLLVAGKYTPFGHDTMPQSIVTNYEIYYFYYLMTCYMPLLLAAYNAVVIVTRSSATRQMVREWWVRARWVRADTETAGLLANAPGSSSS